MKDEEMATEYAEKHSFRIPYDGSNKFYDDTDFKASKDGFLAGLKAGRPQWHNLEKDPNDLPKDSGIKLCYTRTAKYVCASYDKEYYYCWGFVFNNLEHCIPSSVIIAWCEIPTFDMEIEK